LAYSFQALEPSTWDPFKFGHLDLILNSWGGPEDYGGIKLAGVRRLVKEF